MPARQTYPCCAAQGLTTGGRTHWQRRGLCCTQGASLARGQPRGGSPGASSVSLSPLHKGHLPGGAVKSRLANNGVVSVKTGKHRPSPTDPCHQLQWHGTGREGGHSQCLCHCCLLQESLLWGFTGPLPSHNLCLSASLSPLQPGLRKGPVQTHAKGRPPSGQLQHFPSSHPHVSGAGQPETGGGRRGAQLPPPPPGPEGSLESRVQP